MLLVFGDHRIVYDTENTDSRWRISVEAARDLEDRFKRSGGEIVAERLEIDFEGAPCLHCLITWDGKRR